MHNPRLQPLLAVVIVAVLAAACSGETAVEGEPGQGEGDVEVELDTARGRREAPAVATRRFVRNFDTHRSPRNSSNS